MWQCYFQIYLNLALCVFIQANSGILHESGTTKAEIVSSFKPRTKCTSEYCTCADITLWDGVVCEHVGSSSFPLLGFWHLKYLPEKMFEGLRISAVYLWNSDISVAENVFQGILGLDRFLVIRSSIKDVPDLRFVQDSITSVNITSSHLTSLKGKHLQNLPSVYFLSFFNNSIRYMDPDVFEGTYNVRSLDLSYNKLTSLPAKLLDPMMRLQFFSADHNNLLHVDNLFSVTRPQWIYLDFNNITNFSMSHLFNLQKVQPISMFKIQELDLSYNFIRETSSSLSTCNQDSIIKIRTLKMNGNELLNLNDCLRCSQLNKLVMIGNPIQFLSETDFISVYKTDELLLRENQIRKIDTDTFKPLNTSLQELDLSSNKITSINGSVKHLSNLRMLNLSHNSIQTFMEHEFTGLHSLTGLYLQHNQIKSLGTSLQNLANLVVLNITHNGIKLIKPDQVPKTLKTIYLEDIPLKCDCKNLLLIDMLKHDKPKGMCLRSELENSLRNNLNCPDGCSCKCTEYEDGFSMFVDCSSRNLSLVPHFMGNNLEHSEVNEMFSFDERRYLVMYQNIDPSLLFEGNVLGISLENNRLNKVDAAQLPPNLVQLYLSDNNLKRFPQHVIDNQLNLKQVSLSGNPWICDCEALKFKTWLTSKHHIVKDFDKVLCGMSDKVENNLNGSVIWKLNDADLCPTTDFVWISSVLSLAFVIFCLLAKVIYAKYELNIKVSLYSHGLTFVKEEIIDQDKAFDAFISFSHKDDEFVIVDIISEIENRDSNIRLCLHYRHFRPGVPIVDNITHAVQKSKRTVLMLSRNFLESEWCLLEFQTAHIQTLQDKVHRVIAVMIGELPKKIDPTLRIYLDSTTYLTWGENNFWNKLLYVLPSRSSDTSPVLRFVSDNEAVFNSSFCDL